VLKKVSGCQVSSDQAYREADLAIDFCEDVPPLSIKDVEKIVRCFESGGAKEAHSRDDAVGILQLTPQALSDCGIDRKFYKHRMAQVDCAVRLYVVNRRNLNEPFNQRFGLLPEQKRERLFGLMLVQSYHSGIGNLRRLLEDGIEGKAAQYFAEHHMYYSADDIMTGLLFHNLGREPWGWSSLYYLIDIELVESQVCLDALTNPCESS